MEAVRKKEAFREQPGKFDLVITDEIMPKVTGSQFAQVIMNIRKDIPIILCTGTSQLDINEKAKENGIRAIVKKPTGMNDFARAVRSVMDGC